MVIRGLLFIFVIIDKMDASEPGGKEIQNLFQRRNCFDGHCLCPHDGGQQVQLEEPEERLASGGVIKYDRGQRSLLSCMTLCSLVEECEAVFTHRIGNGKCIVMEREIFKNLREEAVASKVVFGISNGETLEPCSIYVKVVRNGAILDDNGCPYIEVIEKILKGHYEDDEEEWMIIQRRIDDTLDFARDWEEYKRGFGDVTRNFWMGLDRMHQYTKDGEYRLKLEAIGSEDMTRNVCGKLFYESEEVETFIVGPESERYKLKLVESDPNVRFVIHDGAIFRTMDRPNAVLKDQGSHDRSGWWCSDHESSEANRNIGDLFYMMGRNTRPAVFIQMKIRKKPKSIGN